MAIALATVLSVVATVSNNYRDTKKSIDERLTRIELPTALDKTAAQIEKQIIKPLEISRAMAFNKYGSTPIKLVEIRLQMPVLLLMRNIYRRESRMLYA